MTNDERRAWLDALKPGDEVVVCGDDKTVSTVVRRTPSGQIVIKWGLTERTFDPNGSERGGDRRWPMHLKPLTDAWRAEFEHRALVAKLDAIQWRALPLEKLRKVAATLEEAEKPE